MEKEIDIKEYARLLEGLTAEDIIASDEFRTALKSYAAIEVRLMKRHIRSKFLSTVEGGLNTALRMVMRDEWNADTLTEIFRQVIDKRSLRPASERELVRAICMRAYAFAMREIVEEKRNLLTKSEIR